VLFAVTNTSSLRNPENAKNLVAVGASQERFERRTRSAPAASGPTADGRRKPEVFAPGCSHRSSAEHERRAARPR
jgi:hypothetical protein